jgi:hypothetical protein
MTRAARGTRNEINNHQSPIENESPIKDQEIKD